MEGGGLCLKGNNARLSQLKICDFGHRESGIWRKSIAAAGSRSREWRSMVAKKAKRVLCVKKETGVAPSALSSEVNGNVVILEDPADIQKAPSRRRDTAKPENVASIILGGAPGDHLFPLTSTRAAPAVPVGGCYRLIDIPMSNCIHSGIRKIFVMTQSNSTSLNRHISGTYGVRNGHNPSDGSIEVLAATQSPQMNWFLGTADAVRQFAWLLEDYKSRDIEYIVILSGDQLHRMDYMDLVQRHVDAGAQITISCVTVDDSRASDYGLLKVDTNGRVIQFQEKPKGIDLEAMKNDNSSFLKLNDQENSCIASMGVYVFNKNTLLDLLRREYPKAVDFGSQIFPSAVKEYTVQAYLFEDYWADVGTIKSFFEANLALTDEPPKFHFYDQRTPIITSPRILPPNKIEKCRIIDSIIAHGCFLLDCSVQHSIVGKRSRIDYGAQLKDTLMLGASTYETDEEIASLLAEGEVPIGVGENTQIRKSIIDLNARIGKNVVITNKDGVEEADRPKEGFYIRSGITVVTKNATIKDGTVI